MEFVMMFVGGDFGFVVVVFGELENSYFMEFIVLIDG